MFKQTFCDFIGEISLTVFWVPNYDCVALTGRNEHFTKNHCSNFERKGVKRTTLKATGFMRNSLNSCRWFRGAHFGLICFTPEIRKLMLLINFKVGLTLMRT